MLIEDGTISGMNATLGELLPAHFLEAGVNMAYENVTLAQILGMLSGLANGPPDQWAYDYYNNRWDNITAQRGACARDALRSTPQSTPGTSFIYSNWGYIVVGHIIEELTGESWETILRQRLFAPLGIDLNEDLDTFTGMSTAPGDPRVPETSSAQKSSAKSTLVTETGHDKWEFHFGIHDF